MTDTELQRQILDELNWSTDESFNVAVPMWWAHFAGFADPAYSQNVTYLYTRHKVLTLLRGKLRKLVDSSIGPDQISARQQFLNVQAMIDEAWRDVQLADPAAGATARVGSITPTTNWEGAATELGEMSGKYVERP